MNALFQVTYNGSIIRLAIEDGTPWVVARDVCNVLGISNHNSAISLKLDDDERKLHKFPTKGGPQNLVVISESGLYHLLLRSRKHSAKLFSKWVLSKLLPSVKHLNILKQTEE